jgi:catechol 2,3-dioxygenase-like lactoylglutathione lyase family enzyme
MAWGAIAEMGSVTIQTADLDACAATASEVLGLTELRKEGDALLLTARSARAELVYVAAQRNAFDHVSLIARDEDAVASVRRRVLDAGFPVVSDAPLLGSGTEAVSFRGPDGYVFEVSAPVDAGPVGPAGRGADRYGHVNFHPTDARLMKDFLVDILDFRVSDTIGTEAFFLRCNADHHGIALIQGRGTLHHHAWQVQSIADLARIADRLYDRGDRLLWGPVRHGAGHNIAIYFRDPSGAVIEVYTDLEQIYDDERRPVDWDPRTHDWLSKWVDWRPDDFRSHGLVPVAAPAG